MTTQAYTAFNETPDNSAYHRALGPYVRDMVARRGRVRVLELGAGRASFLSQFQSLRGQIEYHAQDVTPQNADYLSTVADRVIIEDVSKIEGPYDLVFSTYVLEHVAAPREFLQHVRRLLSDGGVHAVICPRYDVPGYLCPSLRHHKFAKRLRLLLFFAWTRLLARLLRRPRFWVNTEPAVFHTAWFRDADAVHVVSQADVARWHRANGFRAKRLVLPASGLKQQILRRLLTTSLVFTKIA